MTAATLPRCAGETQQGVRCARKGRWLIQGALAAEMCLPHAARRAADDQLTHLVDLRRGRLMTAVDAMVATMPRPRRHTGPLPATVPAIIAELNDARDEATLHRPRLALINAMNDGSIPFSTWTDELRAALRRAHQRIKGKTW